MSASRVTSIPERRNWIRALGWIVALAVAAVIIVRLFLQIDRPTEFHSYFTASRLVMEGQSVDQFYDNAWFREQSNRLVPGLHEIFKPNVPTTAVAYGPFAFFQNYVEARLVWTVLSLLLLVWFIEELIRIAGADSVARPFWYAAVLLAQPIQLNLFQGQAYIVVAAGLILALKFWQRTRDIACLNRNQENLKLRIFVKLLHLVLPVIAGTVKVGEIDVLRCEVQLFLLRQFVNIA